MLFLSFIQCGTVGTIGYKRGEDEKTKRMRKRRKKLLMSVVLPLELAEGGRG